MEEVWTAIGQALAADAQLTALLANGADSIFYAEEEAPAVLQFPVLRMHMIGDGPDVELSALGNYEPRMQIDIFGPDPATNEKILRRLDEVLTVPRARREPFETDSYIVRSLYRRDALRLKTPVTDESGRRVVQVATDWQVKVTRT